MLRALRALAIGATVLAPVAASPASANTPYAIAVQGTGTVSPGVSTDPNVGTFQHVEFTVDLGIAAGAAGSPIVATECTFEGDSSSPETLLTGAGSGLLSSCNGASVTGTIQYTRTLHLMTLSGTLMINGSEHDIVVARCEVTPTSANPVTTYALTCEITAD